jgi:ubiquinone/menaquinone biosynthesis C-methylase UbiE
MIQEKTDRFDNEIDKIKTRYLHRKNISSLKYNPLNSAIYMINQEKERVFIKWLRKFDISVIQNLRLLEIGCGSGDNLIQFIKLGFSPNLLVGNELLPERVESAKKKLPNELKIIEGDALKVDFPSNYFDIVFQSMVFSSILNKEFKNALAEKMWKLVKPGGGVLWYDFIYNNPKNPDVKGIPFKEVQMLFPYSDIQKWRVTLAPPLSRAVTSIHPLLYNVINIFPFLRSHILCWTTKKG